MRLTSLIRAGRRTTLPPFVRAALALAAASGTLTACADAPTSPSLQPAAMAAEAPRAPSDPAAAVRPDSGVRDAAAGAPKKLDEAVVGLLRDTSLQTPVSATFTVTHRGGTFAVPRTGLSIVIPAYAVPVSPMTITVSTVPGRTVAYEFGPHGTRFNAPLTLVQSAKGTNFGKLADPRMVEAAYFAGDRQLDLARNIARVGEFLPVRIDAKKHTIAFDVWHFSGYLVSSGRSVGGSWGGAL